ncbi:MAG: 4Fe-4S binding protein [Candidatus Omnitrophica bacterium]|nr:4Fe-4S binding protein [Candidatus Omnitrophota bacterium]
MADENKINIDKEKCKGCMLCIGVCPMKILKASGKVNSRGLEYVEVENPEKCTGCGMCVMVCPDCAIVIKR